MANTDVTTTIIVDAKNKTGAAFSQVESGLNRVKGANDNMAASVFKGVAAWDLLKQGIKIAVDFFKSSVSASIEASKEMALVKQNVENAGIAYNSIKDKLDEYSKSMIQMGFDDEETATSVSKLMMVTGDYNKALLLNQLAMDLARSKGIALEEATTAIAQVTAGNVRILKQYGIVLKDNASAADALSAMHDKVKGSMVSFANTTAGKIEKSTQQWQNLKEQIGEQVQPSVDKLMDAFNENLPAITKLVGGLATALGWVAEGAVNATSGIMELFEKRTDPLTEQLKRDTEIAKKASESINKLIIKPKNILDQYMPENIIASGLAKIKAANDAAADATAKRGEQDALAAAKSKNLYDGIGVAATNSGKKEKDAIQSVMDKLKDYKQNIKDIQKAQEDESLSFIKSQIEKRQSFDQQLADMIKDHKEKWQQANKDREAIEREGIKTPEDLQKIGELRSTAEKEFSIIQPYLNNTELTKLSETSDVERLLTAYRSTQAEDTVATAEKQKELVEKAQNITINFDLTNSTITDTKFIEKIKQELNKSFNMIRNTN